MPAGGYGQLRLRRPSSKHRARLRRDGRNRRIVHSLYYREMHAVEAKWQGYQPDDEPSVRRVFAELNAVHARYWLMDTRFAEYWEPAFSSPPAYDLTEKSVTIYADMLGNFIAMVAGGHKPEIYLLSVVRDKLKIIDRFF